MVTIQFSRADLFELTGCSFRHPERKLLESKDLREAMLFGGRRILPHQRRRLMRFFLRPRHLGSIE
jgi:hypothetical protein